MKTVVGLFDRFDDARAAVAELEAQGFGKDAISLVRKQESETASGASGSLGGSGAASGAAAGAGTGAVVGGAAGLLAGLAGLTIPVIGPAIGAGWLATTLVGAGVGAATGGLAGALMAAGVPEEHANYYNEGVKRGGTLVTVRADDARADLAAQIMNRHDVIDLDERFATWQTGTAEPRQQAQTSQTTTTTAAAAAPARPATTAGGEQKLDVVEENLKVGKRAVAAGGVRVYAHVTERPVQEQINLREERVDVERRPVDRPATAADLNAGAFREESIEVTTRREEPVVQKEARVVEEVVVRKDVAERTETVRDTVRRKDVQVEKVNPDEGAARGAATRRGFEVYETDFRKNHDTQFARSGYTYEQSQPLYRSAYDLAGDPQHASSEWATVEPHLRQRWETQHPNSWDRVKDVARNAWERARAGSSR